jgi:hypothetical protein
MLINNVVAMIQNLAAFIDRFLRGSKASTQPENSGQRDHCIALDEVKSLVLALGSGSGELLEDAIGVACETGITASDVLALRWSDLSFMLEKNAVWVGLHIDGAFLATSCIPRKPHDASPDDLIFPQKAASVA